MRKIAILVSAVTVGIGGVVFACGSSDPALPDLPRNDAGGFDVAQGEGSAGDSGPQNPVDAFCKGTLGAYANFINSCCSVTDKALPEGQALAMHAQSLVANCVSALSSGLANGRIMYQQAQAQACITAYTAKFGDMSMCASLQIIDPSIEPDAQCAQAFVGVGDKSALCANDLECKDGLTCVGNDSGNDGLCRNPSSAVDGPCGAQRNDGTLGPLVLAMASHPACAAGFYCDSGSKCKAQGGPAFACTRNDECTAPARCDGNGKCTAAADDALVASGAPCKSTVDCQLGLWCDHTNVDPMDAALQPMGVCASKKSSPDICATAEVGECAGICSSSIKQCVGFCGAM